MSHKEQIEAIWAELHVDRIPGHDMSNECRLAAEIIRLRDALEPDVNKLVDVGITVEGELHRVEVETGCRFREIASFVEGVAHVQKKDVASLVKELKALSQVKMITINGVKV